MFFHGNLKTKKSESILLAIMHIPSNYNFPKPKNSVTHFIANILNLLPMTFNYFFKHDQVSCTKKSLKYVLPSLACETYQNLQPGPLTSSVPLRHLPLKVARHSECEMLSLHLACIPLLRNVKRQMTFRMITWLKYHTFMYFFCINTSFIQFEHHLEKHLFIKTNHFHIKN